MKFLLHLAATSCNPAGGGLFGFPKWYKYLQGIESVNAEQDTICSPHITSINDVWLIGAAIIDMLLRLAVLLAIGYIVYGGVSYIKSQGQPDQTASAQKTILNAVVGLVIAIAATGLVTFVAGRFK